MTGPQSERWLSSLCVLSLSRSRSAPLFLFEFAAKRRKEDPIRVNVIAFSIESAWRSTHKEAAPLHAQEDPTMPLTSRFRIPLTPRLLKEALDTYIVGQTAVKTAMSIAVYNHLVRTETLARSTANLELRPEYSMRHHVGQKTLERDGSSKLTSIKTDGTERSIQLPSGAEIPVVEVEKSNILLLGPTGCGFYLLLLRHMSTWFKSVLYVGSGKTLMAKTLASLVHVPLVITDATCITQVGCCLHVYILYHPVLSLLFCRLRTGWV